jgi:3-hydroxyacyl-[acyl-carrier-protein] dehydratase
MIEKIESREEIERLIPHRPPFLFVDTVDVTSGSIRGTKRFDGSEFFFAGHFPGHPVVPGVLLVETMAQCGGVGVRMLDLGGPGTFFFAKVREARFRRPVRPGETFHMEIENIKVTYSVVHQRGVGSVDGETAVEAEWIAIVGVQENN